MFRVVRDGVELTDGEIGSRKSRALLKLLAIERPGLVPVDRIVEILWPDERPAAPEQNVATMVSRLRAALGTDLQYAGQSTVELMHFLGREPAGGRLLMVATIRAENEAEVGIALELCEAALEARLLVVSGRDYEFANDLIREVLYASTPEPTRMAHHRRAADLLTGQPESLARHAAVAGDWLRAARAWLRAAEDTMAGTRRATRPRWPRRHWRRPSGWRIWR